MIKGRRRIRVVGDKEIEIMRVRGLGRSSGIIEKGVYLRCLRL